MASRRLPSTQLWGNCSSRVNCTSVSHSQQQLSESSGTATSSQFVNPNVSSPGDRFMSPRISGTSSTSLHKIESKMSDSKDRTSHVAPFMMQPQVQEHLSDGGARFKLHRYAKEMLDSLQAIRLDGCLCDVTLRTAEDCRRDAIRNTGDEIKAHKVILAGSSLYFRGMFTRGMREATMSEVCIREANVTNEALRMLVDFAYSGEIHITQDNVQQLLVSSVFLQMPPVIEACTVYLEQQLDPSNCVGMVEFARAHDCLELETKARRYIHEHFCDVAKHEEILDLSAEDMADIIQREDLNVNCESEVFSAVVRWVEHDPERRLDQLESLLARGVRLSSLAPAFLEDQLQRCHLIRRKPSCYKLLMDRVRRLTQHAPMPCAGAASIPSQPSTSGLNTSCSGVSLVPIHMHCDESVDFPQGMAVEAEPPPRRPGGQMVIYVAGGFHRKVMDSLKSFEYYDPSTREWARLPDLLRPRCGPGVVTLQGRICVVGGRVMQCGTNTDACSLDVYDPRENQWTTRSHMNQARSRVGVCVLDGMIYAMGGSAGGELHSSAERYCQDTDSWEYVASMHGARHSPGVAVLNRLIYVIGGFDGRQRLQSVECYHPEKNQWEPVSPMLQARSAAGVTVLRGYIYVVGGFDGTQQLKSVERYNPSADCWEEVAPLLMARSGVGVAAVDDKLYALGGFNGSDFLPCVESYNPDTDSWQPETRMLYERSGHGVTVGRMPTLR
ncbi:kelch-like ech-associated protein 1 [Plakobranchus ocellatus]|uniref:Kelch-like ech-associated protein 1 n=1 Tax=Plakobranchus ocellatus TaxID=259542 RepID=A0AAV4A785_9GAST|nr:kelch-like ech-associated protein 1 [Plakobranchus ocellatus]